MPDLAAVRILTTDPITLSGAQTLQGVMLVADVDRVGVAGQTGHVDDGLYLVKAGAWERAG